MAPERWGSGGGPGGGSGGGSAFSPLDLHLGRFLEGLEGRPCPELRLAAALASRAVGAGHVCLDLAAAAREAGVPVPCPELGPWVRALRETRVVGEPGTYAPLVLDPAGRLYLHRYWAYEDRLVRYLRERAGAFAPAGAPEQVCAALGRLFPASGREGGGGGEADPDWQRIAAAVAACRPFCVVSGGPGTGKTTAVVQILALLALLAPERAPRMALAAPTGKAASRLQESVRAAKGRLADGAGADAASAIPDQVSTVHRLLGALPGTPRFRHRADDPLPHDVVVVDEASMVDLPLMAKLVDALRPEARLLLLGDKDQLASVQAGAVLGDLCGGAAVGRFSDRLAGWVSESSGGDLGPWTGAAEGEGLADSVVLLRKSYRFGVGSGIGRASRLVNAGDGAGALGVLADPAAADTAWAPVPAPERLAAALREPVLRGYRGVVTAADPGAAHEAFGRVRLLCALRTSPYGVEAVNRLAEGILAAEGLIEPRGSWYAGRPVLVTENDYRVGLFNGDVGIALRDPSAGGALLVFFPAPDGALRRVPPARVPPHETAYALTVHKSQGSEFDEVLLVLGAQPSRVLTRELVYTGLTRARSRVEVWGTEAVFREAVSRRVERSSGLRDALWGPGNP
ncbi:MAG: exodeoxyribonuclease V subunit alpha [Thermodesulfobacteriota bacterium]